MKNPIVYLLVTGWAYAGKHRSIIVLYTVMFALAQAMMLAEPYIIGKLINCLQAGVTGAATGTAKHDHLMDQVKFYLLIYFVTQVGFWVFHGPGRLLERFVAFNMKAAYKGKLFSTLTRLPLKWHREHHSGDSIDKVNRASNSLFEFFDTSFEIAYMFFRLIGSMAVLVWFMPGAGVIASAVTLLAIVVIFCFDKILVKNYSTLNRFENSTASAVHDYVTNIISVITLRLEHRVHGEVSRRMFLPLSLFKSNNAVNEIKWCITTVLIASMIVAVLGWYTATTVGVGKTIEGGTFFTLFEYLRRIGDSFYQFAWIYGTVVRQAADVKSAEPIANGMPEACGGAGEESQFHLPREWDVLEVKNLSFTYEDDKHRTHHLKDINLTLKKGLTVAFVGESGSGKSTLLSLLRGTQSAHCANVFADAVELPGGLKHIADATTLMPQDPEIFSDTIGFNLTFGLEVDENEVREAIRLARFEPVLKRLPSGLETSIAEKGVNLSGGEKQRLALARGIFFARDSEIILLDEPTSSVDPQNERVIYANILGAFPDRCVVSSLHKLHLLDMFDVVYVFHNGEIVEFGEVGEVLAQNGRLSELFNSYEGATEMVPVLATQTAIA
ncbi:MAG: ABC transporter ATP-binding protein [Candidatus Melainabacteria bacterium]|nr:ABC transporter ATP-binding protein [Candidatus Melainabacteria bacterium]